MDTLRDKMRLEELWQIGRGAVEGLGLKRDLPFAARTSGPSTPVRRRLAGRRVLVTGHTGFKGSWLALWLQALGADVCGLALPAEPEPNHLQLLGLAMDEALVDLRDADGVARGARSASSPRSCSTSPRSRWCGAATASRSATFDVNVDGPGEPARGGALDAPRVRVVVNATTDKCYLNREPRRTATARTTPLGGHDPYSASKACAEIVSASYRAQLPRRRRPRPAVRSPRRAPATSIGGGDWSEDRLIPDLVRAADERRSRCAIRYPQATRPWQHVLEPLAGYLLLGERLLADPTAPAEAWNFGPDASGAS